MDDSDLRLVVDCASLAPSVHNTQPWRFHGDGDRIEVRADHERRLAYLDPTGRQLHVSCGAAVEFARLAVRDLGYGCQVAVLPDPADADLVAVLVVGDQQPPTDVERSLAEAMPRRYTDRSPYDGTPVPAELLAEARAVATELGVWLRVVTDPGQRTTLAAILTDAEAAEAADPEYAAELAARTRETGGQEGIPAEAAGRDWPAGVVDDMPLRDFTGHAAHPHPGADDTPPVVVRDTLVLLGTETDTPADWVHTGRALAWLLLRAAAAGVSSQPLGPAIDQHAARLRLRRELHLVGHAQFLLRMGYGSGQPHTGRRTAGSTLIAGDDSAR
jgi:nitroreductase